MISSAVHEEGVSACAHIHHHHHLYHPQLQLNRNPTHHSHDLALGLCLNMFKSGDKTNKWFLLSESAIKVSVFVMWGPT
jgi:hypothetical protein